MHVPKDKKKIMQDHQTPPDDGPASVLDGCPYS